jgi:hypothetical protein
LTPRPAEPRRPPGKSTAQGSALSSSAASTHDTPCVGADNPAHGRPIPDSEPRRTTSGFSTVVHSHVFVRGATALCRLTHFSSPDNGTS